MPLEDILNDLASSENLKMAGSVLGGYVVSEQVGSRVIDRADDVLGIDLLNTVPEASGVVTAAGFYGVASYTDMEEVPTMMAYGALAEAGDKLLQREAFDGILGGAE
jgi:hypothetical protein